MSRENLGRSYLETYIHLADSARYIELMPKTEDKQEHMKRFIASSYLKSEAEANKKLAIHYLNDLQQEGKGAESKGTPSINDGVEKEVSTAG